MQKGIGIQIPLKYDKVDGPWKATKTYLDAIKQNFKYLLLTAPTERVMDPNFGVGIKDFLFENLDDNILSKLSGRIYSQVNSYMPFLTIIDADAVMRENTLYVKINYFVDKLQITDQIYLEVA